MVIRFKQTKSHLKISQSTKFLQHASTINPIGGLPVVMAKGHDFQWSCILEILLLVYLLSSIHLDVNVLRNQIGSSGNVCKTLDERQRLFFLNCFFSDGRHLELFFITVIQLPKRKFTKSSFNYYSNSDARFHLNLSPCGDIHPNPGPSTAVSKPKCSTCHKAVRLVTAATRVNCGDSFHKKCARFRVGKRNNDITWTCSSCNSYLDSFLLHK